MARHSKMWWCSTSLTFDIQDNSASHATPPHHTCLERLTTPCLIWHTLFLILFLTVLIPLTSSPPHMLSKLSLSSATIFVFTKAAKVCTHVFMRKWAFSSFFVGSEGVCVCMSVRPLFFFRTQEAYKAASMRSWPYCTNKNKKIKKRRLVTSKTEIKFLFKWK